MISQSAANLIVRLRELEQEIEIKRLSLNLIEEVEEELMLMEYKIELVCRRLAELI